MNKIKYFSLFIFATAFIFIYGCGGDDVVNNNNNGGGSGPTLNMTVGSTYSFTNDSLDTNGAVRRTQIKTTMVFAEKNRFYERDNAFKIRTTSVDTFPTPTVIDIDSFYVYYDGGKFYQYGMVKLIDSTQPANWDLVADFTVTQGTEWNVTTINTTINGVGVTANIKGKVASQTSFNTTSNPSKSINAYKIEITAYLTAFSLPIGNIVLEYYIGYADPSTNPSGLVRLKLNPIRLAISGTPFYGAAGLDQVLQTYFQP